jgi:putative ABC transport system permease protein
VSLTAGVLFGLAPAIHATTPGLASALRASGRAVSGSSARRNALVVSQVAMTLVLLVVAGLLMQSLYRLRYADVGFRPEGVITLRTALPSGRYPTHARRVAFYDDVLERVTRLPGVLGAGYTTSVPLAWKGATTGFIIEGQPPDPGVKYDANHRQVSTDYLKVIGVPLIDGRYFTGSDQATPISSVSYSSDHGTAWSAPARPADALTNVDRFNQRLSVDPATGDANISFYDTRRHTETRRRSRARLTRHCLRLSVHRA